MRRLLILAALTALAGCGEHGAERLPAACSGGAQPVLKALAAAPGAVRVQGVPISHCFNRNASGDDLRVVGTTLLTAAQQLSGGAAGQPEGGAALRLGFLIGAARRGSARNGVATELVRRLQQEQGNLEASSNAFRRGLRGGLAQG